MHNRLRIVHVTTSIGVGGAQMMLLKLVESGFHGRHEHIVISLIGIESMLLNRFKNVTSDIRSLGMRPGGLSAFPIMRLTHILRELNPDIILGWMYHGNLLATISSILCRSQAPVAWNIRQALYDIDREKAMTRIVIRLGAKLSRWPHLIIYNSRVGQEHHRQIGFDSQNDIVIHNGFDLKRFNRNLESGSKLRNSIGVGLDEIVIGLIGRYDPMKDHKNFFLAAKALQNKGLKAHLLLVGPGVTWDNSDIRKIASGIEHERIHLLGEREDIPKIINSMDILTSSSVSEGFPNVLGEAMACGIPCVATDVGDSAYIIGNTGIVVPPGDPHALAAAWEDLLTQDTEYRCYLGKNARQRIRDEFALDIIARRYQDAIEALL